ncbi:MAG: sensor histidine kinase, partial [Dehalococcoidia bacterium]
TIRFANMAARKLLGRNISGKTFGYNFLESPADIEIKKKGRVITADMRSTDITWRGSPARLVSIRDISRMKRASEMVRELSRRLLTSQEKERQAIGHELHDEVGGLLTGLKLALHKAKKGLGEAGKRPEIDYVDELVDETMEAVSVLSHSMRPEVLNERGLVEALEWHFDEFQRHTDIAVEFSREGISGRLPADIETAAYRIVQEALTNAARYSRAPKVMVTIELNDGVFCLNIEDSGRGFDPALISATSLGIAGMQDRAYLAGGELSVYSSPGAGTRISCEIPIK